MKNGSSKYYINYFDNVRVLQDKIKKYCVFQVFSTVFFIYFLKAGLREKFLQPLSIRQMTFTLRLGLGVSGAFQEDRNVGLNGFTDVSLTNKAYLLS